MQLLVRYHPYIDSSYYYSSSCGSADTGQQRRPSSLDIFMYRPNLGKFTFRSRSVQDCVNLCPVYVPLSLGRFPSRPSLGKFTSHLRPVHVWVNLCPVYVPLNLGTFTSRPSLGKFTSRLRPVRVWVNLRSVYVPSKSEQIYVSFTSR